MSQFFHRANRVAHGRVEKVRTEVATIEAALSQERMIGESQMELRDEFDCGFYVG